MCIGAGSPLPVLCSKQLCRDTLGVLISGQFTDNDALPRDVCADSIPVLEAKMK